MAGVTDWYIDPLDGDDTNTGTSEADAWKTFGGVVDSWYDGDWSQSSSGFNTDRINIKSSTTMTLTENNRILNEMVSNSNYPLILRGYDTTPGDSGRAVIDCNGYRFASDAMSYYSIENIELTSSSNINAAVKLGLNCRVLNCVFHDFNISSTYSIIVSSRSKNSIINCQFYDCAGYCIKATAPIVISSCYFENSGTKTINRCIFFNTSYDSYDHIISDNIAYLDSSSDFVVAVTNNYAALKITGNTVITSGSSSYAAYFYRGGACIIADNIFEGFDNAIYHIGVSNETAGMVANNYFYDNTTDIYNSDYYMTVENNYSEGSSGITKSGSVSYDNRLTYFQPTGNALGNSVSGNKSIGAVQLVSSGGGGGGLIKTSGMSGGFSA